MSELESQGKRRPPSVISLASGTLSFGLLIAQAAVAEQVMPKIGEWLRTEPRLAMIGIMGVVLLPGVVVTIAHRAGHRLLDNVESGGRRRTSMRESWWAGALAWMVMYGTSILARVAYFIVNPPDPRDSLSFSALVENSIAEQAHLGSAFSVYALLWIAIASAFYELERQTRR